MLAIAESRACMPEAQLRITVHPGTFWPQPIRSAATRPMFTSSTEGAAQPRITSSSWSGAKAWRIRSDFPAAVARSLAENGPGRLRDLMKGVRAPSTIYTAFDIGPPMATRTAAGLLRGGALRLRGPGRLGSSQVLREMIDADHLVAQLRGALEQRQLLAADDLRGERRLRELIRSASANRAGLLRGADLGLDCLGLDRSVERRLQRGKRVVLSFRRVDPR